MRYLAVVKADAYGHGMPQMVRRLMQSGVDYFAVANVAEAADIRHMGAGWPILILSPLLPGRSALSRPRFDCDCQHTRRVRTTQCARHRSQDRGKGSPKDRYRYGSYRRLA